MSNTPIVPNSPITNDQGLPTNVWRAFFRQLLSTGASGSGTVTSVSVVTANGFNGTVANDTTTPAITLKTSVTGILKGDGTGVSAETTGNLTDAGTDGITVTGGTGAVLGSGTSLAQHVADATHNGYLSSTDWNTFNTGAGNAVTAVSVVSANGLAGSSSGGSTPALTLSTSVTGLLKGNGTAISAQTTGDFTDAGTDGITVTGGSGAVIGSGTSIAQHVADTTHSGYLSSTDWNTFNGKGSGTVTAVSIASANGFAGSSSGGSTPALTLQTSINAPALAGNGTAISAATTTGSGSTVVLSSAPTLTNPVVGTQSQGDGSTKAASTSYVDVAIANAVAGVNPAVAVQAATTAASDTSGLTYTPVAGIGDTFTGSVGAALVFDGYTVTAVGQRVLVKNDTQSPSGAFNGVYYLTQLQTGLLPPILTRALDYDTPSDINNTGAIPVINGTVNGTTSWVQTAQVVTVGTTPLSFTKFTRNPADYLLVANNLSDVSTKATAFNNLSPMTTAGDLIYGGTSGAGTRLATGTAGTVLRAGTTPAWSTATYPSTATGTGTLIRADGTNWVASTATVPDTAAQYDLLYASATNVWSSLAKANTGTLITSSAGVPSWANGGTGNRLLRTDGSTVSFAQAALATDVSGTLAVANGGTGQTTYTDGQLLIGNSTGNTLAKATITAGSGISVTNGSGAITIAATGINTTTSTPYDLLNLGLSTSVGSNAMTINLIQSDGSTNPASGSGAVTISFRSATATTGGYNQRQITSALSIVIPSGASLGQTSAINQYVWVYAMDNAGTVELAVSGVKVFPDNSIQSSSTIGAGSTSGTTLYSATGRSNLPIRIIGRLLVNESTAGTWASNATDIVIDPILMTTTTAWNNDLTWTWTGLGTVSANDVYYKRIGDTMFVRGHVTCGTTTAVPVKATLPTGIAVDSSSSKISNVASVDLLGTGTRSATSTNGSYVNGVGYNVFYDGSDTTHVYFGSSSTSNVLDKNNATANLGSGNLLIFNFAFPVAGWSEFGP